MVVAVVDPIDKVGASTENSIKKYFNYLGHTCYNLL